MTWAVRFLTLTYGLPVFLLYWAYKYIPKDFGARRRVRAPSRLYNEESGILRGEC